MWMRSRGDSLIGESIIGDTVGSVVKGVIGLVIMETVWVVVAAMVRANIENTVWIIVWVIDVSVFEDMLGSIVELTDQHWRGYVDQYFWHMLDY